MSLVCCRPLNIERIISEKENGPERQPVKAWQSMHWIVKLVALVAIVAIVQPAHAQPADPQKQVVSFFNTYCSRCHDEKTQKGKFRLDTLSREFGDQAVAQRWGEVVFRMNSGEMPPKKELQPKAEELGAVVEWITTRIKEGEAARMAKRGPVAFYRLSREEYGYTIQDLLGVHFDVTLPGAMNEDPRWHGFERIGAMLTLSPSHVERYLKAAEIVLDQAFPSQPVAVVKGKNDPNQGKEKWLADRGVKGPVRWLFWPAGRRHVLNITQSGTYRIRIRLSGMRTRDGKSPHLSFWHQQLKRSVLDVDVVAAEDQPKTLEFELPLSPGGYDLVNEVPPTFSEVGNHTLNVLNLAGNVFTTTKDMRYLNPTGYMLFDDAGNALYATLIVDWIEWEGPLVSDADRKKRENFLPTRLDAKPADLKDVHEALKRFAIQAWRRPALDVEIARYVKIVENELKAGENLRSAYRAAQVGVLASKHFYYLEEGLPTKRRDQLTDWELASRLSYFLWSSMPDDELRAAAQAEQLTKPNGLKTQVERMLRHPKIDRFTDSFPRQWLQLHRVGTFPPDPNLYPEFDKWLERSMVLESTNFFAEVFRKNLPLREFLVSDWTMVNPRLAQFYGLPPVDASGFQRVSLKPEDHRGGLLTQASLLMLTSDGTRHRPVHRGVLVSEAIFGKTPPPPPPNVEPLAPTPSNKPKSTIRAQLEAHATHATCASCHRKIDPLGFAFDSYDAIGKWRTEERVGGGSGKNPPVDTSGMLADGRKFQTTRQFQQLLLDDQDRFAEAFIEQLATYALRRVMTIDDARHIRALAEASKKQNYQLRNVIENLVMSELFQKR
jgi:mono/diheme cytochrome c family protein